VSAPERRETCGACGGSGQVELGRHVVTHEMAMDAQDLSLEGSDYGPEYGSCPECGGGGRIVAGDTEGEA
jgi:DnaJ-class molecular chaperone